MRSETNIESKSSLPQHLTRFIMDRETTLSFACVNFFRSSYQVRHLKLYKCRSGLWESACIPLSGCRLQIGLFTVDFSLTSEDLNIFPWRNPWSQVSSLILSFLRFILLILNTPTRSASGCDSRPKSLQHSWVSFMTQRHIEFWCTSHIHLDFHEMGLSCELQGWDQCKCVLDSIYMGYDVCSAYNVYIMCIYI